MRRWLPTGDGEAVGECACEPTVRRDRLVVDAGNCPGRGRLVSEPNCRRTVVDALRDVDVDAVVTRHDGLERAYLDDAAALLVAAGRFADRVAFHDDRLADLATSDPLSAAHEATGRAPPVADVAAESGLALGAQRVDGYDDALRPSLGLRIGNARLRTAPPPDANFEGVRTLSTDARVRLYERPGSELDVYHLEPVELDLEEAAIATLARAREFLASGAVGGERAPRRAVRRVASERDPVDRLGAVLEKHTSDLGVLADLFADGRVSDVFANAPVTETPLTVRVDGELRRTNVRVSRRGADALASQFRLRSGRAFSRANPTLDATATVGDRRVRVAATTEPASDGLAFAFRAHDRDTWTLQRLVSNDTLPPDAAAFLSLAVERAAATLLAGTRGAGKTTMLGALLWELAPTVRTLVVEDTPELPVDALQAAGRDVQSLRANGGDGPGITPAEALRTGLRLGEGALVVGEVRGEEAAVLYEAMRVGANGSAVLGTIHGDGGERVRERVVSDLGVPESSFATTDLVVTLEPYDDGGDRGRRVASIEAVVDGDAGVRFAPLFVLEDGELRPTGRIDRGNSRLVPSLTESGETYAQFLATLAERERSLRAETGVPGEPTWAEPTDAGPC
ncbi:ATPase, T2SS/T4P/T4SS family [Halobacteria archaeon HArc-gm2]|nr:ATPase, T2SS/T4P/T4SS family [Halobacteria archaeon HArc-gm2]